MKHFTNSQGIRMAMKSPQEMNKNKQKELEDRLTREILPLHHMLLAQGFIVGAVPDGKEGEDVTIYKRPDMEVTIVARPIK